LIPRFKTFCKTSNIFKLAKSAKGGTPAVGCIMMESVKVALREITALSIRGK
jgi:hypothetical protein